MFVARAHQAHAVGAAQIEQPRAARRVDARLAQRGIVVVGLRRMIEKQRLVQKQRDGLAAQLAQRLLEPEPLLGFRGLPRAAEELRVDSDESPAAALECPALFTEMFDEACAARVVHALVHLAGDDVVADVVIAREIAARHREAPDAITRKSVIGIVIRIVHDRVAVNDHDVGALASDPGGDFRPVVEVVLLPRAEMHVGNLGQPEIIHRNAPFSIEPTSGSLVGTG